MWCQNSHRIELPYSFQAVAILANDKIPLISKKKWKLTNYNTYPTKPN